MKPLPCSPVRHPLALSRTMAALLLLAPLYFSAFAADPLRTIATLDLARYVGVWHQIALLPNRFQSQCIGDTTAEYQLRADGRLDVINRCRAANGSYDQVTGIARHAAHATSPGVFEVRFAPAWLSFLPWVWGDYWILALDPDYRAVLIGSPNRQYLWVLAREPHLDEAVYARYLDLARTQGFSIKDIVRG